MVESYSVQYRFIKDYNLVVERHIGTVQLGILIKSMHILRSKKEFSNKCNFLIDLRASKFDMDINKVKEFVAFLEDNFSIPLNNKIALIADESDQVAMATLFKMLQPKVSRNIHVFSTLEYALLWLNIDVEDNKMEKLISETTALLQC